MRTLGNLLVILAAFCPFIDLALKPFGPKGTATMVVIMILLVTFGVGILAVVPRKKRPF